MKIQVKTIDGGKINLTASFTTDHPASSYGQAVMLVDEWDDCMSHQNWVLAGGLVIEAADDELTDFNKWRQLIEAVAG